MPGRIVIKSKRSKYGAIKVRLDGHVFDSKAEAARYQELRTFEIAGVISNLGVHRRFTIHVNNLHICEYICDFDYREDGKLVIEDVKGMKTPAYKLKKKLMLAVFGISILETGVKRAARSRKPRLPGKQASGRSRSRR